MEKFPANVSIVSGSERNVLKQQYLLSFQLFTIFIRKCMWSRCVWCFYFLFFFLFAFLHPPCCFPPSFSALSFDSFTLWSSLSPFFAWFFVLFSHTALYWLRMLIFSFSSIWKAWLIIFLYILALHICEKCTLCNSMCIQHSIYWCKFSLRGNYAWRYLHDFSMSALLLLYLKCSINVIIDRNERKNKCALRMHTCLICS